MVEEVLRGDVGAGKRFLVRQHQAESLLQRVLEEPVPCRRTAVTSTIKPFSTPAVVKISIKSMSDGRTRSPSGAPRCCGAARQPLLLRRDDVQELVVGQPVHLPPPRFAVGDGDDVEMDAVAGGEGGTAVVRSAAAAHCPHRRRPVKSQECFLHQCAPHLRLATGVYRGENGGGQMLMESFLFRAQREIERKQDLCDSPAAEGRYGVALRVPLVNETPVDTERGVEKQQGPHPKMRPLSAP
jgi:hypothetical protein